MTINATTSQPVTPDDKRAAMVAAIRALADFIETRTDLPVPASVHAQHSLPGCDPVHADTVRAVAEALGVEADIYDDDAHVWFYVTNDRGISVRYVVHGVLRNPAAEDGDR